MSVFEAIRRADGIWLAVFLRELEHQDGLGNPFPVGKASDAADQAYADQVRQFASSQGTQ